MTTAPPTTPTAPPVEVYDLLAALVVAAEARRPDPLADITNEESQP